MELIIAGATGYVATELIRQSLRRPEVMSVVALARKTTPVPSDIVPGSSDAAKFTSVVVKDYEGPYDADDSVKTALAGADACIWTVAITPSKSSSYPFEDVRRICQTNTLAGLRAMYAVRGTAKTSPFRFMYMSGVAAERDQSKSPRFKAEYSLMRVSLFSFVLAALALPFLSSLRSLFLFCPRCARFVAATLVPPFVSVLTSLSLILSSVFFRRLASLADLLANTLFSRAKPRPKVLTYAAEHKPDIEPIIVKPGLITSGRVV
jgi:hypothetical protein